MISVSLFSTGSHIPLKRIENKDITGFPAAFLPLIAAKTGVEARHVVGDKESTSTIAIKAAQDCLSKIGFDASQIDCVIVASSTPDRLIPATATKVAHAIGAHSAFAFDMNSVCSSGVYMLEVAKGLIVSGMAKHVLAVAADTYSKFLNPNDFSTCPYFGDGAGAVLLGAGVGMLTLKHSILHSMGDDASYDAVTIKGGGSELPYSPTAQKADYCFKMDGKAVFAFATSKGAEVINALIEKNSIDKFSIKQVILHQANINIVYKIADDLALPRDIFFTNLQKYGNTAGASVIVALDEYLTSTPLTANTIIFLCAFGGGLSWGASYLSVT